MCYRFMHPDQSHHLHSPHSTSTVRLLIHLCLLSGARDVLSWRIGSDWLSTLNCSLVCLSFFLSVLSSLVFHPHSCLLRLFLCKRIVVHRSFVYSLLRVVGWSRTHAHLPAACCLDPISNVAHLILHSMLRYSILWLLLSSSSSLLLLS